MTEPSPSDKLDCAYLCFAHGESDLPSAVIAKTREEVLQFLVDEWYGEPPEKMSADSREGWDATVAEFDNHDWREEGVLEWKFEIGGVEIRQVALPLVRPECGASSRCGAAQQGIGGWLSCEREFGHPGLHYYTAEAPPLTHASAAVDAVMVPRETLARWEGWARVRGNEIHAEADRPSFLTDGLADEMKAALVAVSTSGAREILNPSHDSESPPSVEEWRPNDTDDARRWRGLKELAGYFQDGSQTDVKLYQDDATRSCFIKVGDKHFGTDGSSFNSAIDSALSAIGRSEG